MGKRTIILTRRQIDEISDGGFAWLDNQSETKEDFNNSVYTTEPVDGKYGKPITTDKVAKQRTPDYAPGIPRNGGSYGNGGVVYTTSNTLCCSKAEWKKKNMLSEESSNITYSPTEKKNVINNGATGDTTAAKLANGESITKNNLDVHQWRLNNAAKKAQSGDVKAAQTFQNMGGDAALKADNRIEKREASSNKSLTQSALSQQMNPYKNPSHKGKENNGILHIQNSNK